MTAITFDKPRVIEWVNRRLGEEFRDAAAIGLERDGELIAGVLYDRYNKASICMHVAADGSGWLTRKFLWRVFFYPFSELKVNCVIGIVSSANERAQRFDEHLGFKLQARIKDAMPDGDLLVYRLGRDECKWHRLFEGKQNAAI